MSPRGSQPPRTPGALATAILTLLALLAFAANSILTRLALGGRHIDAAAFTSVRLVTGALVLLLLVILVGGRLSELRPSGQLHGLAGPLALFAYAAPFTFAYLRIGAAVGALVLFGSVQLTMIGWGVARGERPAPRTWLGLALAAGGLLALMLPSASRPDLGGVALMVTAGVAWGAYSLQGKGAPDPLAANARAFLGSAPLSLLLSAATFRSTHVTSFGLVLAAISGGLTSALGYAVWYRALRGLTATRAAILQLSVPVIAAAGAVLVLDESPTARLGLASVAVLGGVALAVTGRASQRR
jgi:drug/metabolite transporter (DMT)-like permease